MCLHPYELPNPAYGLRHSNPALYARGFYALHDNGLSRMPVPCGHCPECVCAKQSQIVQRLVTEAKFSYVYFATLTYDNKHLPRLVVGDYELPFADITHIQLMMKRIRDNKTFSQPLKYALVSELGSSRGRPHFHCLFFVPRHPSDDAGLATRIEKELRSMCFKYFAVNIGTRKEPIYEPLFTYRRSYIGGSVKTNFDLHLVKESLTQNGSADVAYYISKYILKPSDKEVRRQRALKMNLDPYDYDKVWDIVKSKCILSKGLGVFSHLETHTTVCVPRYSCEDYANYLSYCKDSEDLPLSLVEWLPKSVTVVKRRVLVPDEKLCAELHKDVCKRAGEVEFPVFRQHDGKLVPLSRYYKRFQQIFNVQDALTLYFEFDPARAPEPDKHAVFDRTMYKHKKVLSEIELHGSFPGEDCNFLFNS